MMNEQEHGENMKRIREWYFNRVSVLSMRDYRAAGNPHYGKRGRIHKPYGISAETEKARELYALTLESEWTDEHERWIKAFKLRTELLLANGAIT